MSSSSSFSPWVHEPPQGANAGGKRRNAGNGRGAGWAGGTQPTPACAPGTEGSARPTAGGWRRLWSRRAWEAAAAAPLRERPTAKRRRAAGRPRWLRRTAAGLVGVRPRSGEGPAAAEPHVRPLSSSRIVVRLNPTTPSMLQAQNVLFIV
jgi:hypothetical protein